MRRYTDLSSIFIIFSRLLLVLFILNSNLLSSTNLSFLLIQSATRVGCLLNFTKLLSRRRKRANRFKIWIFRIFTLIIISKSWLFWRIDIRLLTRRLSHKCSQFLLITQLIFFIDHFFWIIQILIIWTNLVIRLIYFCGLIFDNQYLNSNIWIF